MIRANATKKAASATVPSPRDRRHTNDSIQVNLYIIVGSHSRTAESDSGKDKACTNKSITPWHVGTTSDPNLEPDDDVLHHP